MNRANPQTLAGIKIGHFTHERHTGCTVFLCPPETVASVGNRGPAPGSREAALLGLDKPIRHIHAVMLSGGSAFGLCTADGAMRWLAERGIGHPTPIRPIPLVPAAIVYDLFAHGGEVLPEADWGYQACAAAALGNSVQGNVGAGAGVTVGKWGGPAGMMKGGFGLAEMHVDGGVVAAAAVVNAIGDIVDEDGTVLAGSRDDDGGWRVDQDPLRRFPDMPPAHIGTNTTLVVVATDGRFDKIQAYRLAERAHDGIAIAVRPAHTTHDGDTSYALATGRSDIPFETAANATVLVVAEAIRNGVRHARGVDGIPGLAG